jgi:hypothetical protein
MSNTAPKPSRVRYRVLARCFVNGHLVEPTDAAGNPAFVMAPPGLAGKSLKLEPEVAAVPAVPLPGLPGGGEMTPKG